MGEAKKHVPLSREEGESASDYLERCARARRKAQSKWRDDKYIPIPLFTWIHKNDHRNRGFRRKKANS
jgi:hypothetical protein